MKISEVNRGIFEAIRKRVVSQGYYPDITESNNAAEFEAAKTALKDGFANQNDKLIEVFGVGSGESRDQIKDSSVYINRRMPQPGSLGGWPAKIYESYEVEGETKFKKWRFPDNSYDIEYDVRYLCKTAYMEGIITEIILNSLGSRKFIQAMAEDGSETGETFLIQGLGSVEQLGSDWVEGLIRFVVKDVWVTEFTLLEQDIPQLIDISPEIIVQTSDGEDDDTVDSPSIGSSQEFEILSQAEYDALVDSDSVDTDTIYIIT